MPPRVQTWCTYLLRSLPSPLHTYIGFTNDPLKRLRQHNGELVAGARRTHKKRPWEMLAVLSGFPTQVAALQFEWAWQHPTSSKAVRDHVRGVPSRGAPAKLQVLIAMLQIEPWSQLPLRLHFASGEVAATAAAFPRQPPPHIATRTSVGPIADLWIYADAARLLAVARAAKSEERAAARALKLAAKTRQRGAKGGGGGCGSGGGGGSSIYDSASVSAGSSWEGAGSVESAPEEEEGGGGGDAPAPRRSSLHRFRVRRRSEVATAVAEEVEVINISSDSEEAATAAGAPAAGAESLMEVLEVVDDEEGGDGDIGDEGLDEAWPLSQGSEVEEAVVADLLALPLAERLRRRLEAEAGGGGGSGGGPAARPAPAGAASAPCACCGAPVSVSEHASAWLRCEGCGSVAHATCLADYFLQVQSGGVSDALLSRVAPTPAPVPCPARGCAQQLTWPLLVEEALRRGLVTLSPAQLRRALDLEPSAAPRPPKKRRIKKK